MYVRGEVSDFLSFDSDRLMLGFLIFQGEIGVKCV